MNKEFEVCFFRIYFDIRKMKTLHCTKVPLKRSFLLQGTKKTVPVNESPSYPGSHLSEVFLPKKMLKMRGPTKTVPLSESPSYPGSQLTRVYCIAKNMSKTDIFLPFSADVSKLYIHIWPFLIVSFDRSLRVLSENGMVCGVMTSHSRDIAKTNNKKQPKNCWLSKNLGNLMHFKF